MSLNKVKLERKLFLGAIEVEISKISKGIHRFCVVPFCWETSYLAYTSYILNAIFMSIDKL